MRPGRTHSPRPRFGGERRTGRSGFTTAEAMVTLGILAVVALLLAQVACQVLMERRRNLARQTALEAAANVLEAARACPWDDLTPAWAARQRLPKSLPQALREARLDVRVEPERGRPHTRRITVAISWQQDSNKPAPPVQLVGLRSARSAAATGGTP